METSGTVQQRLTRLFQERDNVKIGDLLSVVQSPDDLRSNAFKWAVMKLGFKLDHKSQEGRDFEAVMHTLDRYGLVCALGLHVVCVITGRPLTMAVHHVQEHGPQTRESNQGRVSGAQGPARTETQWLTSHRWRK